jgi:hypothetical protein
MHKSLTDAVEDELIQHNPAPKSPPKPALDPDDDDDDIREKVKVLTPGQVDTMLERAIETVYYALLFIAVRWYPLGETSDCPYQGFLRSDNQERADHSTKEKKEI